MATVSATATELRAVAEALYVTSHKQEFKQELTSLLDEILQSYEVVLEHFQPLCAFNDPVVFEKGFPQLAQAFADDYLTVISLPRIYAELTFQKHLQFWKLKETQTKHPLLSNLFTRLKAFIDKWIDNDIYLAMTIDSLFKSAHRVVGEVNELLLQDAELGYLAYQCSLGQLTAYLNIIQVHVTVLRSFAKP